MLSFVPDDEDEQTPSGSAAGIRLWASYQDEDTTMKFAELPADLLARISHVS